MTARTGRFPQNRRVDSERSDSPLPSFSKAAFGREGYAAEEVDAFAADAGMALHKDPPGMAPYEVADQQFHVRRFRRGYRMRPVDDYLDEVQADLRRRHAGHDAVAGLDGQESEVRRAVRPVRTWWIYAIGLVLLAAIIAFGLRQL